MKSWLRSAVTTALGLVVILVALLVRSASTEAFVALLGVGVTMTSCGGSLLPAAHDKPDDDRGFVRGPVLLLVLSGSLACASWSLRKSPAEWAACVLAAGRVAGEWVRENPPLDAVMEAVETAARFTALIAPCLDLED